MTQQSDEIAGLAKALSAAQGEFGVVAKTAENPFFKSKFAALPAVVQEATPILAKLGLSVVQLLGYDGPDDTLTTRLMHESGQWIESTMRLYLTKKDSQGLGSATTYARRYAYMAILGLVADEDDDGNGATVRATKPSATTTKRAAPVAPAAKTDDSKPKMNKLFAMLGGREDIDKDDDKRHVWASHVLSKDVKSFTDLSSDDVRALELWLKDNPPLKSYAEDDPQRPF